MRRRILNSGYSGNTDQRRTAAGTISASKHYMERSLGLFRYTPFDADTLAYITAVETADGQSLEGAVITAINAFVVGCKADGIWAAMKATCILAGARTLAGSLVPLKGTAPTNANFVSADYNRKTGLVGGPTNKYLNSNAPINTSTTVNNAHLSLYISVAATTGIGYIGRDDGTSNTELTIYRNSSNLTTRIQNSSVFSTATLSSSTGFVGAARAISSSITFRANNATETGTYASASAASYEGTIIVFARDTNTSNSNGRLAFYSIGEALNLALLDTCVTTLINAYATAIA